MAKPEYHLVSLSGGKDSTAMVLKMLEMDSPINEVVTFDTGMEFPEMYDHLNKLYNVLTKKQIKVTVLRASHTFEYHLVERERVGKDRVPRNGFGWPNMSKRWCTAELKEHLLAPRLRELSQDYEVVQYIGIASDEKKRLQRKTHTNGAFKYPLVEWGWTESDCLNYCYSLGYDWGGLYRTFARVSCWCCPLQPIGELYKLWNLYPELWAKLEVWDKKLIELYGKGAMPYKGNSTSIEDLTKRFIIEKQRKEANLSTSSRNFYRAVKFSIEGLDKRQKTLEGY